MSFQQRSECNDTSIKQVFLTKLRTLINRDKNQQRKNGENF